MVWLAVDKDGTESVFDTLPPVRDKALEIWKKNTQCDYAEPWYIELPEGSIEKLIGRTLTWEDNYVEYDG